jgi:hypothetical protein
MLIDSNIIIYATKPEHADLRRFIEEHMPAVSAVSYVEVLGYQRLNATVELSAPRPREAAPAAIPRQVPRRPTPDAVF